MALLGVGGNAPLSIFISPSSLYTSRVGAGSLTSAAATGIASGGAGGYTYAWTYVSGDSYSITAPAAAATAFSTNLAAEQFKSGVYRCTVTDSLMATAFADITVDMESLY